MIHLHLQSRDILHICVEVRSKLDIHVHVTCTHLMWVWPMVAGGCWGQRFSGGKKMNLSEQIMHGRWLAGTAWSGRWDVLFKSRHFSVLIRSKLMRFICRTVDVFLVLSWSFCMLLSLKQLKHTSVQVDRMKGFSLILCRRWQYCDTWLSVLRYAVSRCHESRAPE